MKRPLVSFILALVSVIVSPILILFETSALWLAGMVNAEPANSPLVKVLAVAVVVLIGLLALAAPVTALILGFRGRAASKAMQAKGVGLATAAVVIAGIVSAGVLVAQVYLALMVGGVCSLEGC